MDLLNHSAPGASNPAASLVCFSDGSDGGLALSIESHRSMPAPFLTKTYQLIDDPTTNHIVSWGEDNTTFVVWRPADFARDLLPNYFKHNNFSSFVRQLNTYGFRKIVPDRWEFANEFFRKGEKHLLCEIHRRKTAQNNRCSPTNSSEERMMQQQVASPWSPAQLAAAHAASPISSPRTAAAFAVAAAHHMSMQQAATARNMQHLIGNFSGGPSCTGRSSGALSLSDENERLRRDNTLLLSELTRMRKLYHDVLLYLQHQNAARTSTTAYSNATSRMESPSGSFHMAVPATPSAANLMLQAPVSSFCGAGSNGSTEFPLARVTTPLITCASNGRSLETTVIPFNLAARKHEISVSNLFNGERQSAADQSSSTPLGVELRANLNPKPAMCAPRAEDSNGAGAGAGENCMSSFCNVRNSATAERSPPRLFGVPLKWCKKRPMGGAADEDDEDQRREDHHVMLCSMKSNKKSNIGGAASMSLELSKEPPGASTLQGSTSSSNNMHAGAPWLKFNANRDEQVYN